MELFLARTRHAYKLSQQANLVTELNSYSQHKKVYYASQDNNFLVVDLSTVLSVLYFFKLQILYIIGATKAWRQDYAENI